MSLCSIHLSATVLIIWYLVLKIDQRLLESMSVVSNDMCHAALRELHGVNRTLKEFIFFAIIVCIV